MRGRKYTTPMREPRYSTQSLSSQPNHAAAATNSPPTAGAVYNSAFLGATRDAQLILVRTRSSHYSSKAFVFVFCLALDWPHHTRPSCVTPHEFEPQYNGCFMNRRLTYHREIWKIS